MDNEGEGRVMITISRTTDPAKVTEMSPHFVVPVEDQRVMFSRQLAEMIGRPDILVLIVESDKSSLVGFIVAQSLSDSRATILQAWASANVALGITKEVHDRVILWALALGKTHIEVRSARSAEALYRRFGYEETAKILTHTIDPSLTQRLMDSLKELTNG